MPHLTRQTISELPLFPLNTVLFPGGLLPLQIFEVRYLHMVGACRRDNGVFGVVALVQGSEVRQPGDAGAEGETFQGFGTLARIIDFAAPMPGLMRIRCLGEGRFRLRSAARQVQGLWRADVDCLEPEAVLPIPDDLQPVAQKLGRLIRLLQERGVEPDAMPIRPPFELEDCAWVANRWSELLPLPHTLRRDLYATESPVLRLELIGDLLDRTELPF